MSTKFKERLETTTLAITDATAGAAIREPRERRADKWISTAYGATFGAGLLFFVVSFVALGAYPAVLLHQRILQTTPPTAQLALTPQERHGRTIYDRNG
jgi:cytochrome c oxidase cbb3-type subunit I/II